MFANSFDISRKESRYLLPVQPDCFILEEDLKLDFTDVSLLDYQLVADQKSQTCIQAHNAPYMHRMTACPLFIALALQKVSARKWHRKS
jgi:hypothetical protein